MNHLSNLVPSSRPRTRRPLICAASIALFSAVAWPAAQAATGTWISTTSGLMWSDPSAWSGGVVADGAGFSALFNTIDLTAPITVLLDTPRTIGNLFFADADPLTPANWILGNSGVATNVLTLAGATPTINVTSMGTGSTVTLGLALAGTSGLTFSGTGTILSQGNPGSTYTGGTVLSTRLETTNVANAALTVFGSAVATNTLTFDGGYFKIFATAGATSAGTLVNNMIVNTTGTLEFSGRSAASGTLTGGGIFNVITHFVRSDNTGNWSGFTGTINVSSGDAGVSDFRNSQYAGFGLATLNLGTNANLYFTSNQGNNAAAYTGTNVSIGALSGVSTAFLRGGPIAGRVTNFLIGAKNVDSDFAGAIVEQTTGALTDILKQGSATLTLSGGSSSYNGPTRIDAGTLAVAVIGNGGAVSSIGQSSNAAASLIINNGSTLKYGGAGNSSDRLFTIGVGGASLDASGTGPISFNNAGAIALTTSGTARTLTLKGTNSDLNTITPQLADAGAGVTTVTKAGSGSWFLAGLNGYTGVTTISGGVLSANTLAPGTNVSSIGASTNAAANLVIDGGALRYTGAATTTDRAFTVGVGGATLDASGTGAVAFTDTAATVLAGTDTARTITLTGANPDLNTLAATLGNNGTGATSLVKNGAGRWVISGPNTYSAGTTINAGTLSVRNTTGSGTGSGFVTVNSGGTLGGTGTISGAPTINSGGHVAPGESVGTLTLGGITLNAGAILDYEFNNTPNNDKLVLTTPGGLTLNSAGFNLFVENTTNKFTAPGTYNLIQFSGAIGGTGLDSSWTTVSGSNPHVLNPQSGLLYSFSSSVSPGFIALTIGANATISTWINTTGGVWGNPAFWSAGVPGAAGDTANFFGAIAAPSTIDLNGNRTVGTLQFDNATNSYTIAQVTTGKLTLSNGVNPADVNVLSGTHTISAPVGLASNTTATVNAGATLTVSGSIDGAGTLTKSGPGTLALSGTNTHPSTTLQNGTLDIGGNSALGGGAVTFTGNSRLRAAAPALAPANAAVIGGGVTATIDSNGQTLTLGGVISETGANGALTKAGNGTLVLGGANTYSGATTVGAGTLSVSDLQNGGVPSNIGQSPSAATSLVFNGATLAYTGAGSTTDRLFTIGTGGATLDASGTAALTFINSGAIALTGTNVARTLTLTGSNPDANTLSPTIANNGTGATALLKSGPGAWTLASANTFTGLTSISGGVLKLGNALALQSSTLDYNVLGGSLSFESLGTATLGGLQGQQDLALENNFFGSVALTVGANNTATSYFGALSGIGSLVKTGTGLLTLGGASSYTGGTVINAGGGIIKAVASGALGTGNLQINNQFGFQIGNGVTLTNNIGEATGANEFLDVPDAGASAILTGTVSVTTNQANFRLGISGAGATLTLTGPINVGGPQVAFITRGNIVLAGNSLMTVNNDSLQLGRAGVGQALNLVVKDNAAISAGFIGVGGAQNSGAVTVTLQDSGSITANGGKNIDLHSINANVTSRFQLDGGTLTAGSFTKTQTTAGRETTINFNGGTLKAGVSNVNFLPALTGLSVNVQNGGGKIDTNGFDVTIAQPILHDAALGAAADAGIMKNGLGALTLTGAQTYSALYANAGVTNLRTSLGTGDSIAVVGATATLNFGADQTLSALVIGADGIATLGAPAPAPAPALFADDFGGAAPEQLTAQAVPEPGSAALLLGGMLTLLGLRRRS